MSEWMNEAETVERATELFKRNVAISLMFRFDHHIPLRNGEIWKFPFEIYALAPDTFDKVALHYGYTISFTEDD